MKYAYFGENMIRYTKDGASYIDGAGKTVWTQSFEMKTPVINVNGDYAVIADQQGNQLYICSTAGCTGRCQDPASHYKGGCVLPGDHGGCSGGQLGVLHLLF